MRVLWVLKRLKAAKSFGDLAAQAASRARSIWSVLRSIFSLSDPPGSSLTRSSPRTFFQDVALCNPPAPRH